MSLLLACGAYYIPVAREEIARYEDDTSTF